MGVYVSQAFIRPLDSAESRATYLRENLTMNQTKLHGEVRSCEGGKRSLKRPPRVYFCVGPVSIIHVQLLGAKAMHGVADAETNAVRIGDANQLRARGKKCLHNTERQEEATRLFPVEYLQATG